jgi:hypothetical protein
MSEKQDAKVITTHENAELSLVRDAPRYDTGGLYEIQSQKSPGDSPGKARARPPDRQPNPTAADGDKEGLATE